MAIKNLWLAYSRAIMIALCIAIAITSADAYAQEYADGYAVNTVSQRQNITAQPTNFISPELQAEAEQARLVVGNTTQQIDYNQATAVDRLVERLKAKQSELINFIAANNDLAVQENLAALRSAFDQIKKIEEENGIADLHKQVADLRIKVCRAQQEESIAGYSAQVKTLTEKVKELTKEERRTIDNLAQTSHQSVRPAPTQQNAQSMQTGKSLNPVPQRAQRGRAWQTTQNDVLIPQGIPAQMPRRSGNTVAQMPEEDEQTSQIKEIENAIRVKTSEQIRQIKELNKKIYAATTDIINEDKPLALKLKKKYEALYKKLRPFDEQIAQAKAKIDASLKPQAEQIKRLKREIRMLRRQILKHDPCFAARESMRESSWEVFFI